MKNCPQCGAEISDSAAFCPSCGKPVNAAEAAPAAQPAPAPAPAAAPTVSNPSGDTSIGTWVLTMVLMGIPLVNLICLIVWAVSDSAEHRSRKNWAIASFIMLGICIVVTIVLVLLFGETVATIVAHMQ